MDKTKVKVKKLHEDAKLPIHASDFAAGCDFYSIEEVNLESGKTIKVRTGLAIEMPTTHYLRIEDRSGMAIKGIHKVGGIIDSDYRGEISIILHNSSGENYKIEKGDRIAQGILTPVSQSDFVEVDQLSETSRGTQGFHSTGKK